MKHIPLKYFFLRHTHTHTYTQRNSSSETNSRVFLILGKKAKKKKKQKTNNNNKKRIPDTTPKYSKTEICNRKCILKNKNYWLLSLELLAKLLTEEITFEPPHDKTNKMTCTQRRLRSAWASAQSNQSLRYPHEGTLGPLATHWAQEKTSIKLGGCPGWSKLSLCAFRWFCQEAAHWLKHMLPLVIGCRG